MKKTLYITILFVVTLLTGCIENNTGHLDKKDPITGTDPNPDNPTDNRVKKVLISKFTATNCQYCPGMTSILSKIVTDNPNKVVILAHHGRNDEFVISKNTELYNVLGSGYPSALIDYRDKSNSNVSTITAQVAKSLKNFPAISYPDITVKIQDRKVIIDIKTEFTDDGDFKIGCVVSENGIERKSTFGSSNGIYDNVVRAMPAGAFGTDIGAKKKDEEFTKSFEVDIGEDWNSAKLEVVAYILKKETNGKFYVNNVTSVLVK